MRARHKKRFRDCQRCPVVRQFIADNPNKSDQIITRECANCTERSHVFKRLVMAPLNIGSRQLCDMRLCSVFIHKRVYIGRVLDFCYCALADDYGSHTPRLFMALRDTGTHGVE